MDANGLKRASTSSVTRHTEKICKEPLVTRTDAQER